MRYVIYNVYYAANAPKAAEELITFIRKAYGSEFNEINFPDFAKKMSELAESANKGKAKIVPFLNPGAGVVTPRADAHWIITEYGAVDLYGKSLQERAKLLISIAHPDDREMLDRASFERFGPHWHSVKI